MYSALSVSNSDASSKDPSVSIIENLREQAAEVRAELEIKRQSSARFWKATYGILALGLSAYGVAKDLVLPGVGGLLPMIQLLMSHKSGQEADIAKLVTKPGYVLIRARYLLSHADN
jgi:hypothetical protein